MRILNDQELDVVAGGQAHTVAAKPQSLVKPTAKNKVIHTVASPNEYDPGGDEPGDGGGGGEEPGDGGGGDGGGGDYGGGDDGGGDYGGDYGSGGDEHDSGDEGSEGGDDPSDPYADGSTDGSSSDGNVAAQNAGIAVKPGADITDLNSKITDRFGDIKEAFGNHTDIQPVITSGDDSTHMNDSAHYTDNAIDMRANNISDAQANAIVSDLKATLGSSFFIQYEKFANPSNNHIHIQYNGH